MADVSCAVEQVAGCKTTKQTVKPGSGKVVEAKDTGQSLIHFPPNVAAVLLTILFYLKRSVTVHATGVVVETGKKFWSTHDAGQEPFQYQAGVGGVIKGSESNLGNLQV
jgi:hypothetical protein